MIIAVPTRVSAAIAASKAPRFIRIGLDTQASYERPDRFSPHRDILIDETNNGFGEPVRTSSRTRPGRGNATSSPRSG